MANQNRDIPKRKRGSRETGVWVQLQPDQLQALDAWIEEQPNLLSRSEAIRRMVESRLKTKPNNGRSSPYSKSQLRDALQRLRARTPLSDRLKTDEDDDYRDRLIKWTIKYSKSRNAREVYNRLQVPEWIVWLNEAAGESPQRIRNAISAMQRGRRGQRRAADVRKVLRWEQTAQLLFDNQGGYASWLTEKAITGIIKAAKKAKTPSAAQLGKQWRVTVEEVADLGLDTITAFTVSQESDRKRQARRRRNAGAGTKRGRPALRMSPEEKRSRRLAQEAERKRRARACPQKIVTLHPI